MGTESGPGFYGTTSSGVPIQHLDYKYVEKCTDTKELEKILKVLRSGEEGHYPELVEFTEKRLETINPRSRALRKDLPVKSYHELEKADREEITDDFEEWMSDINQLDANLKSRTYEDPTSDFLPPVRSTKTEGAATSGGSQVSSSREHSAQGKKKGPVAPRSYQDWDKFNPDEQVKALEEEEEAKVKEKKEKAKLNIREARLSSDVKTSVQGIFMAATLGLWSLRLVFASTTPGFERNLPNGTRLLWGRAMKEKWREIYGENSCPDNLRKREILTDILKTWTRMASENNITYMIMYGSLLGAVRTFDILPWDHDLDIMVSYSDILKLEAIANTTEPRGSFRIQDGRSHLIVQPKSQHCVPMDDRRRFDCNGKAVHKLVDACSIQEPLARLIKDSLFMDFYHYNQSNTGYLDSAPEGKPVNYSTTDIFPLRPCWFMGIQCFCPNHPTRVLEAWYGEGKLRSNKVCKQGEWREVA